MRRLFTSLLAIALTIASAAAALAAPAPAGPTDPAELDGFVSEIITRQMKEYQIPGAVFLVVKDGRILFSKGYGLANVEKGTPVVPDKTLFAIGSVTKLFTATAVMQLAEQGKLDLHGDVNQYLKEFQVPATYPEPITVTHLLTHTAGFDERIIGIASRTAAETEPLGQYLARSLPRRIRPPGEESQYSNHGNALAGYLVETISGRSYEEYITTEILEPLGMKRSTLGAPAHLADDITPVNGYVGEPPVKQDDWFLSLAPAGDLRATATDMAAFMIAHLQKGEYQGKRILREETAKLMQSRQFSAHPDLPGMAYAFMERLRNGHRAIEHAGGTLGTATLLTLLPDQNWGFFVSYNGPAGSRAAEQLADALLDRYAPGEVKRPTPSEALQADVARYAGSYRLTRYEHDSFTKLQGLVLTTSVTDNGDGSLTLHFPVNMKPPMRLLPVAPLLFRSDDGQSSVAFQEDSRGRVTRMFPANAVFVTERLAWYENPVMHIGLLIAVALLALSACLLWPVGALVRRLRKRPALHGHVRSARWIGGVVSGLLLILLGGLGIGVATNGAAFMYGIGFGFKLALSAALLAAVLTLPLVWAVVRAWRVPGWSLFGKLHLALLTLAFVLFIPFLQYWNLLGFKY